MTSLAGTVVAVCGALDASPVEAEGARVLRTSPADFWMAHDPTFDVVVIGAMEPEDRAAVFVRELRADARTRLLPRLVVAPTLDRALATLRGGASAIAIEPSAVELVAAVSDLVISATQRASDAKRLTALEAEVSSLTSVIERGRHERAAMAHDVRVMLAVSLGFACNLRDGIDGALVTEQTASVLRIIAATQDASSLLERAPVSLKGADTQGPGSEAKRIARRTNVDLEALVQGVVELFSESALQAGITLTLSIAEPVYAWCDPVEVKQALVNLLVNALKFTPRAGRVAVSLERSAPNSVRGFGGRATAKISVSDSGPGVPLEERERVFDRGERLGRDVAIAGQGIGLAVVKQVATSHRGSIRIEESWFGGASFVLELPVDLRKRDQNAPRSER